MTRPERTAEQSVEDPVTGEEVNTSGEEPLPSFSEQLADQLGGWRGLIESSIPVTVFVIANIVVDLRPAIIVAVASGLLIAVFRLFRRQSVRHAVNGLFGIFVGAFIAWRSGDARDFYLPGIIISAGYAVALMMSAVFRWPLVGWIWSVVLDGGKTRWREDPVLLRVFGWLTVLWAAVYMAKVGIQYGLYLADKESALGIARLVLGWPPYALLLAITVWSVRRVTRHQESGAA
ncbi:DUF3159 domain-containing protein [Virgisporangium aurantiacum]|uniref:DUF3159 domain-containing protein n=1 Tax=Virgisporangium aurantiacum TaxID=175570 RepID=A0A8J3Z0F1_9ACTN|nr:DUF3159 domain-containing protein [Virgisporangium aurantiacum]GIJ52838.1 hypothetical protein Vau01_003540 [Virgisporangium aurantiacum]